MFRQSKSLIKYLSKGKHKELVNLIDTTFGDPTAPKLKKEIVDEESEKLWDPYWKPKIDLNIVADHSIYDGNQPNTIPPEIQKYLSVDWETKAYSPILYLSDFWVLNKDLIALNETMNGQTLNLTLNF